MRLPEYYRVAKARNYQRGRQFLTLADDMAEPLCDVLILEAQFAMLVAKVAASPCIEGWSNHASYLGKPVQAMWQGKMWSVVALGFGGASGSMKELTLGPIGDKDDSLIIDAGHVGNSEGFTISIGKTS